jgi:hypothetical protein
MLLSGIAAALAFTAAARKCGVPLLHKITIGERNTLSARQRTIPHSEMDEWRSWLRIPPFGNKKDSS